jgi:FkbM family methyltransferase
MSIDVLIKNLTSELVAAVNNDYKDNYDPYRFGELIEGKMKYSFKKRVIRQLNKKGYYQNFNNLNFAQEVKKSDFPIGDFVYLNDLLEEEYSKELLAKIIAYRMLGYKKVKLPLNTPDFWKNQELIEAHQSKDDFIHIDFMDQKLPLTDLNFLKVPLKMYYSSLGINIDFIIKQYEFHRGDIHIQVEKGDDVIDAGGCYADTALYFANKMGGVGTVHAFEFIPDNIEIFNRNVQLNKEYEPVIKLVNRPLWNETGKDVFYTSNGPGSKVSLETFEGYTDKTTTLSIDDYVELNSISKIDFIKMDIEGAEFNALKGASKTIAKYKPKLAIAIYHSTKEFEIIPRFINELNLGYKFYLSHSTIYGEETMLFATTEK